MTGPHTDQDLIERTLGGDEHAFSELYDRYRRQVFATACRILQDSEAAMDATQEIFVKMLRSLSSWDSEKAKFSTWLYRLAANHAIDCWRHRQRRGESQLPEGRQETYDPRERLRDAIRSPYSEVEARARVECVRRFVDDLPELQKKVFVLRYFQELKLEEIAEMENCSLGTVKTSLFRATQTVRKRLRKIHG